MPRLEILVGMIASGKSTYARRRADAGALVISHDALTQMLHGGAYRYEKILREAYRAMEEELAACALRAGRDVVIDRTHLTRESRSRWIAFAKEWSEIARVRSRRFGEQRADPSATVHVIAVEFPIESAFTHAERRFNHDGRGRLLDEWLGVAEHHAAQAQAEPLDWKAEGFACCVLPEITPAMPEPV